MIINYNTNFTFYKLKIYILLIQASMIYARYIILYIDNHNGASDYKYI